MKVRLIGGIREANHKDPLLGLDLQVVAFPMNVTNYEAHAPGDPEQITVHDEDELAQWADKSFEECDYEIFDLKIPREAASPAKEDSVLGLVSSKKAEYERAAPSTPEGIAERDAVIAALDTLHVHAVSLTA